MTNLFIGLNGLVDFIPVVVTISIKTFVPVLNTGTEVDFGNTCNCVDIGFDSGVCCDASRNLCAETQELVTLKGETWVLTSFEQDAILLNLNPHVVFVMAFDLPQELFPVTCIDGSFGKARDHIETSVYAHGYTL
jgi:hypothetical protein